MSVTGVLITGDQGTAGIAKASVKRVPARKAMITKMLEVEEAIGRMPGAKFGDDCTPLEHFFGDGIYIRKMIAPKGMLNVSKLHKTNHPFFILVGDVSIQTEDGVIRIKGPHFGITKAGTKRVVFFHEDTVWITVHANPDNETDLKKIEDGIIAKTYDELPEHIRKESK